MGVVNLGAVTAYAIAKKNGFAGTEKEWLASLKGEKGDQGEGQAYDDTEIKKDIEKKVSKPTTTGKAGQILQTNGDGTTTWVDKPQGGSGGTDVIVDSTLSYSGQAADAAIVGNEILNIKKGRLEFDTMFSHGDVVYRNKHIEFEITNVMTSGSSSILIKRLIERNSSPTMYINFKKQYSDNGLEVCIDTFKADGGTLQSIRGIKSGDAVTLDAGVVAFNIYIMALGADFSELGKYTIDDFMITTEPLKINDNLINTYPKSEIDSKIEDISIVKEQVDEKIDTISNSIYSIGVNVFNKDDITVGRIPNGKVGSKMGEYTDKADFFTCNQVFDVKQGDVLNCNMGWGTFTIYDENKIVVANINNANRTNEITSPDAKYMVYSSRNSDGYVKNFMLCINQPVPSTYVPYTVTNNIEANAKEIEQIKKDIGTNEIPIVILDFDQSIEENDNRIEIMKQYGWKPTFVGSGAGSTDEIIKARLADGWDLKIYGGGANVPTNEQIAGTTDEDIAACMNYVETAVRPMENNGYFNPVCYGCRQNRIGYALEQAIKAYGFKICRGGGPEGGFNQNINPDYTLTPPVGLYSNNLDAVKAKLDDAVANNQAIAIFTHYVTSTLEEDRGYDCHKPVYLEMMDYIKDLENQGKVIVTNYRGFYELKHPELAHEFDYNRKIKEHQFIEKKSYDDTEIVKSQLDEAFGVIDEIRQEIDTNEEVLSDITESVISDEIGFIDSKGDTVLEKSCEITHFIDVNEMNTREFYITAKSQWAVYMVGFYDENKQMISVDGRDSGKLLLWTDHLVNVPDNVRYVKFSSSLYNGTPLRVKIKTPKSLSTKINEISEDVENIRLYAGVGNVLYGKKWVACGDSFTEGDFTGFVDEEGLSGKNSPKLYDKEMGLWKTYPYWITKRNGMTLVNEAKCGSDFTNIEGANNPFSVGRYQAVPNDADYITLMFGLNETSVATTPEQLGTKTDTTNATLWGAYNIVFEHFLTNMPYAKIGIIIADAWMPTAYRNAVKEICEYWGVPYLDLKGDNTPMLIGGKYSSYSAKAKELRDKAFKVSSDNSHPNVEAHQYRSTIIEDFLRRL